MEAWEFVVCTKVNRRIGRIATCNELVLNTWNECQALDWEILNTSRVCGRCKPSRFLIVKVGTIVNTSINWEFLTILHIYNIVANSSSHITHIAYLFGNEWTIRKELCRRISMSIDGERHSLLTKCDAKGADWTHTYPRILHLDGRFITKIHLEFVTAF